MIKTLSYSITELLPYINWIYFFYAWGLPPWCAKTIEESAEKEIKHPIDEKERIQAHAKSCRESTNAFIYRAINEAIEREKTHSTED